MARFRIEGIDVGPEDLVAQLPVECRLLRQIPGPDRPDYFLAALDRPLTHRSPAAQLRSGGTSLPDAVVGPDGTAELTVRTIVVAARIVGEQLHAGMQRFPVMLAYVVDDSVLGDESLDFSKLAYVAVAMITDIPEEPVTSQDRATPPAPAGSA